jgi:HSP20 family molecular chaperone IbpA
VKRLVDEAALITLNMSEAFPSPQSIKVEDVAAKLKDGVLTLHLPKSEAAKPRLIEVTAA